MAVLEPRNLVLPFSNTFNVAAILFVLFVFGIYRFALGRSSDPSLLRNTQVTTESQPPVLLNVPDKVAPNAGRKPEDLIRELLSPPSPPKELGAKSQESSASSLSANSGEDDKLDDVEKALGLR